MKISTLGIFQTGSASRRTEWFLACEEAFQEVSPIPLLQHIMGVPCKPLPSTVLSVAVRRNLPQMGTNVQHRHTICPEQLQLCLQGKQQRRWQEVKKGERIKVKKKQFEQSTPHILPQQKGARTKQGRTLRMSPTLWDICHGQSLLDHRGGAEQAQPGSEASPSKCVCSVPGVILWCLSALYNQQLDEIISLGRCEV